MCHPQREASPVDFTQILIRMEKHSSTLAAILPKGLSQ
jgi:hypothetical protein